MIGKIRKRPGPLTPWSLPARRTTNFCQALAILSESAMMTAATRKGGAKKMSTVLPRARPTRAQAITRKRVIGFIVPPRAWSSRASWRASLPLDAAPSVQPNRESLALPPLRLRHATGATLLKRRSIFDKARHASGGWRPTHSRNPIRRQRHGSHPGYFPVYGNMGIRLIPPPGGLWRLADRTAVLLSILLLSTQMTPRFRPVINARRSPIGGRV